MAAKQSLLPTEICSDATSADRFVGVNDFSLNGCLAFSGDCVFNVTWVAGDCDLSATCDP